MVARSVDKQQMADADGNKFKWTPSVCWIFGKTHGWITNEVSQIERSSTAPRALGWDNQ